MIISIATYPEKADKERYENGQWRHYMNFLHRKESVIYIQTWIVFQKRRFNKTITQLQTRVKSAIVMHADVTQKLNSLLFKAQIRCLYSKKKWTWWDKNDVCTAITLKALSKKAYMYVQNKLGMPLPALTTLRRWTRTFRCPPGILEDVLKLLKARSDVMPVRDRLRTISFDEMNIDSRMIYEAESDSILGPNSNLQVAMVRGLLKNWKVNLL